MKKKWNNKAVSPPIASYPEGITECSWIYPVVITKELKKK